MTTTAAVLVTVESVACAACGTQLPFEVATNANNEVQVTVDPCGNCIESAVTASEEANAPERPGAS